MKEGFDKEIDSILRRRARGSAKPFANGEGVAAAATARAPSHLDADELGAFAEGALPAPARVAAASHLADCDECRGAVVALSRALGGAVESKKPLVATVPSTAASVKPSALRAWAAWLFSPRGMRLAVPVLALSAVMVVSYVALRSRNAGSLDAARNMDTQSTAHKEQANANAPATAGTASDAPEGLVAKGPDAPSNEAGAAGSQPQPPAHRGHGQAGEAPSSESAEVAADTSAAPPSTSAAPPAQPEGPAELAKAAPRPVVVESEPPPASKAEDRPKEKRGAEPVDEIALNDIANRQRRAAQTRVANETPDGGSRNQQQKRSTDNNASNIYGGATAAAPKEAEREAKDTAPAARRGRAITRSERRDAEGDDDARAGETRSAAGHRFRREGNAWVDVNYRSNMRSTGVRRGSEAFRALVADHPEIGRIAEQIGGEVVVVIGRHSYRIR